MRKSEQIEQNKQWYIEKGIDWEELIRQEKRIEQINTPSSHNQ